jgi:hypothetical protein
MRTVQLEGESLTFCPICAFLWTTHSQMARLPIASPKVQPDIEQLLANAKDEIGHEFHMNEYEFEEIPTWRRILSIFVPIVVNVPPATQPAVISYAIAILCFIDMLFGGRLLSAIPGTQMSIVGSLLGTYLFITVGARLEERMSRFYYLLMMIVPLMVSAMVNLTLNGKGLTFDTSFIAMVTAFGVMLPFAAFGYFSLVPYKSVFGFRTIPVVVMIPFFLVVSWLCIAVAGGAGSFRLLGIDILIGVVFGLAFGFAGRKTVARPVPASLPR